MENITPFPIDERINRLLNHHFEFRVIRADQLTVDEEYQRRLIDAHVKRIARDFNPMAFGVMLVSHREDGTLFVIDGQHRWAALKMLDSLDENVPCHVYKGLTRQDEAFIFQMGTQRKAITPVDRFRAKLFYNDPPTVEIAEMLRKYGYGISHHTGFKAVSAVEGVYRVHGIQRLDLIFDLIHAAYGSDSEYVPSGTIVQGLSAFLSRYQGRYDRTRLVHTLQKLGADNITRQATALRDLMKEQVSSSAGRVVLSAYNNGLRTNRLPDWEAVKKGTLGAKAKGQNVDI